MKLYIFLLICGSLTGMEQPLLTVKSLDEKHSWQVSHEQLAQMNTLADQNKDCGLHQIFLPPAVDPANFTGLLPLLTPRVSELKAILKTKNATQIAQIACDADCLGAQQLLTHSLRTLQKRVSKGHAPNLPETLQAEMVENVVKRDPYIASLLFRTTDRVRHPVLTQAIRVCGTSNGTIMIDTIQGRKLINLNSNNLQHQHLLSDCSYIIHAPAIKKSVIFNDREIFLVNDEEQRVIQKWHTDRSPMVLMPNHQGVFAIVSSNGQGRSESCPYMVDYKVGAADQIFTPFPMWCPTALALSSDQNKLVVGSNIGQVSLYDAQTLVCESQIFISKDGDLSRRIGEVCAFAIDPKNKYVACARHVGSSDCELRFYNLKKNTDHELTRNADFLDDICFDKTRPLLYSIDLGQLTIWNIKDKKILHTIKVSGYDGPPACKLNSLVIDDTGAVCTVYGHYADQKDTVTLFDPHSVQELAHCSLAAIAFLIRVSKKIVDGQQITSIDEPDFKTLFRSLPKALQPVIAKYMGWKDWILS